MWDTVRADRLSCYGYDKPTTPNIDKLAGRSLLFEQCISSAPWTIPSHASLFTGLYTTSHGATIDSPTLKPELRVLPEILQSSGYQTFLFSSNPFINAETGFARGFDVANFPWTDAWRSKVEQALAAETAGPGESATSRPADPANKRLYKDAGNVMNTALLDWLDQRAPDKPFFAFINYMEAHWPLAPPKRLQQRFMSQREMTIADGFERNVDDRRRYTFGCVDLPAEEIAAVSGAYDASVAWLDEQAGLLFDALEQRGLSNDTIIIIVADHGDHIGEHHMLGHEYSLYHELLHVPLIIHWPGNIQPGRRSHPVQTLDLFETLVALCDRDATNNAAGLLSSPEPHRPIYSEYLSPKMQMVPRLRRQCPDIDVDHWKRRLYALQIDQHKLILGDDGSTHLFDLAVDPTESRNLATTESTRVTSMTQAIRQLQLQLHSTTSGGNTTIQNRSIRNMLETMGYFDSSDDEPASAPSSSPSTAPR